MARLAALALLAAVLALAAPARAAPSYFEVLATEFADKMQACSVLRPPSDALRAASKACVDPIKITDPPPTACPSAACEALPAAMGADCFAEFWGVSAYVYSAMGAALAGGPALPAAEVPKIQAAIDSTLVDPKFPRLDLAAKLASGDAALAAVFKNQGASAKAIAAVCAPKAASTPTPTPAPAPAATSCAAPKRGFSIPHAFDLAAPKPAASAAACCAACGAEPKCAAWAYNGRACSLKKAAGKFIWKGAGFAAGVKK